jgi:hypothetical protein
MGSPRGGSGAEIAALLDAGNEVLTAKENESTISTGAAVELSFASPRMSQSSKSATCQTSRLLDQKCQPGIAAVSPD